MHDDENPNPDIQEIPDETYGDEEQDFWDTEAEAEERTLTPEQRKLLEESYSLVDAALAYPRKKRKREIETDEQRISRALFEILGAARE